MNAVALICARGGSKGVPGKNIRPLAGRPLIAWAIEQALAVPRIRRVLVSTDSSAIADAARVAGAEVPFERPEVLARDDSPEWHVWRHALEFLRSTEGSFPDALVVVPPTAPLRESGDIDRCLDTFAEGDADIVITLTDAQRSPYFNMVRLQPDGTARLVIPPDGQIIRRQDAPLVYDMTTVAYVARPEFVMAHDGVFAGRVRSVHVPAERALDIDTLVEFKLADLLMRERLADALRTG